MHQLEGRLDGMLGSTACCSHQHTITTRVVMPTAVTVHMIVIVTMTVYMPMPMPLGVDMSMCMPM